ncbi:MAG TPA: hypothetical protein VGR78_02810 [Verrucomicrobiae bacterium]|jgi:hypothetical protein|nr:hypothetical protein [Verrucomicrobiae bacterium]
MTFRKPTTIHAGFNLLACLAGISACAFTRNLFSQGCIPAHYMSLSVGARGISYLEPGQWEGDVSYRYLHAETVFTGTEEQPQLHEVGGRNTIHSIDLTATYAIDYRFSLSLTLPFEHDDYSLPNGDGQRHGGTSAGPGDIRLLANAWILNPPDHPNGNINFSLGVKFPSGDYNVMGEYHAADGTVSSRPVDIAAQLGDGGWGIFLQTQGYQKLAKNFFGYMAGFYLLNPRDVNGTERALPLPGVNSVPDQYLGRAGFSYTVWPSGGLALSLGGRIDGIPVHDLIGDSDGFRRAGYAVYIDPGINWASGKNAFSVNVPVAVERNLEQSALSSTGSFADFIVVASYSYRF